MSNAFATYSRGPRKPAAMSSSPQGSSSSEPGPAPLRRFGPLQPNGDGGPQASFHRPAAPSHGALVPPRVAAKAGDGLLLAVVGLFFTLGRQGLLCARCSGRQGIISS